MGNLSQTAFQTAATPVQNNSTMYALIYTFSKDNCMLSLTSSFPTCPQILEPASSKAPPPAVARSWRSTPSPMDSLWPGRWEYLDTTGVGEGQSVNLLYGPGSAATSVTLTPTFQRGRLFLRADLSYVRASAFTPGLALGPTAGSATGPGPAGSRLLGSDMERPVKPPVI